MILKELSKKEGIAFVQLVNEFITMDEAFTKEEEAKVEEYMNDANVSKEEVNEITFTEALCTIKEANERIKKIIYFELLGLALVDGDYEDHEVGFLEELANSLKIDRASKFKYANFYFEFIDQYSNSNSLTEEQRSALREKAVGII